MPRSSDRDLFLAVGGFAVGLAAWLWPSHASGGGRVSPERFGDAAMVAARWTSAFPRVNRALVLAIMKTESSFNPKSEDHSERAQSRGGAYGLMGMTAATAAELYPELLKVKFPQVYKVPSNILLAKYQEDRSSALLDPNVNAMFGVFYLDKLMKRFHDDPTLVVAAYHAGPATVSRLAQAGQDVPSNVGPHTQEYLKRVLTARRELEGYA